MQNSLHSMQDNIIDKVFSMVTLDDKGTVTEPIPFAYITNQAIPFIVTRLKEDTLVDNIQHTKSQNLSLISLLEKPVTLLSETLSESVSTIRDGQSTATVTAPRYHTRRYVASKLVIDIKVNNSTNMEKVLGSGNLDETTKKEIKQAKVTD